MKRLFRLWGATQADLRLRAEELRPCGACGGAAHVLVASTDRFWHTTEEIFWYFKCGACGFVFMDPVPEDLRPYYATGYSAIPTSVDELRALALPEMYRMEPVLRHKSGGRLLEIGPWVGKFCLNGKDAGFEVTAVEIDQRCVDFLNETVGIRAIHSADPVATLETMEERFDVIALWHSLEHLREPWRVLEIAAERLAPGGILLVATPNIESYEFSLLGAAWRNLDAPRHLSFFPPRTLKAACERLGLGTLELTTQDELSGEFSQYTWASLAEQKLKVRYVRGVARIALKWVANRQERKDDSGPGLTGIFQRRAT